MLSKVPGVLDRASARLPVRPTLYLWLFFGWGVLLWFLSASEPSPQFGPEIPHFDKLLHFAYFAGGGALLGAYSGLRWHKLCRWKMVLLVAVFCSVIGRLDEYHQSFVPGRSGNDTGDWLADTLGGLSGVWATVWLLLPGMKPRIPAQ